MNIKKFGAEAILTVIVMPTFLGIIIPYAIWTFNSIGELRADYSDIKRLGEKIEDLKASQHILLVKIDHLTDYLINRRR